MSRARRRRRTAAWRFGSPSPWLRGRQVEYLGLLLRHWRGQVRLVGEACQAAVALPAVGEVDDLDSLDILVEAERVTASTIRDRGLGRKQIVERAIPRRPEIDGRGAVHRALALRLVSRSAEIDHVCVPPATLRRGGHGVVQGLVPGFTKIEVAGIRNDRQGLELLVSSLAEGHRITGALQRVLEAVVDRILLDGFVA